MNCVKSVQIRSFFWSLFSPNTGKNGPEKTPYLDTFHAVKSLFWFIYEVGIFFYHSVKNNIGIILIQLIFLNLSLFSIFYVMLYLAARILT